MMRKETADNALKLKNGKQEKLVRENDHRRHQLCFFFAKKTRGESTHGRRMTHLFFKCSYCPRNKNTKKKNQVFYVDQRFDINDQLVNCLVLFRSIE